MYICSLKETSIDIDIFSLNKENLAELETVNAMVLELAKDGLRMMKREGENYQTLNVSLFIQQRH